MKCGFCGWGSTHTHFKAVVGHINMLHGQLIWKDALDERGQPIRNAVIEIPNKNDVPLVEAVLVTHKEKLTN